MVPWAAHHHRRRHPRAQGAGGGHDQGLRHEPRPLGGGAPPGSRRRGRACCAAQSSARTPKGSDRPVAGGPGPRSSRRCHRNLTRHHRVTSSRRTSSRHMPRRQLRAARASRPCSLMLDVSSRDDMSLGDDIVGLPVCTRIWWPGPIPSGPGEPLDRATECGEDRVGELVGAHGSDARGFEPECDAHGER